MNIQEIKWKNNINKEKEIGRKTNNNNEAIDKKEIKSLLKKISMIKIIKTIINNNFYK